MEDLLDGNSSPHGYCLSLASGRELREKMDNGSSSFTSLCGVEIGSIVVNSVFIYITVMIHMYIRICSAVNDDSGEKKRRLLFHNAIWVLMMLQFVVSLAAVGEIVMLFAKQDVIFPVSLVESLLVFSTSILVPLFYDSIETRSVMTSLPLLVHFLCCCVLNGQRLVQLGENDFRSEHMRVVSAISLLSVNAALFLLLVASLAKKMFMLRFSIKHPYKNSMPEVHVYRYNEASLLSKFTFLE